MAKCPSCGRIELDLSNPLADARAGISEALFALHKAWQAAGKMRREDLAGRILTIITDEVEPIEDEIRER